jgi:hypothetical protein
MGLGTKDISSSWRPLSYLPLGYYRFFDGDLGKIWRVREAGYHVQNQGSSNLSMYHGNRCRIRKGIYHTDTICGANRLRRSTFTVKMLRGKVSAQQGPSSWREVSQFNYDQPHDN